MAKSKELSIEYKVINAEFNQGIKEINSEINSLNKEFRLQQEQMKHTATETQKYESRVNKLKSELSLAQKKTAEANAAYEKAKELMGENSKEAQTWKNRLLDAQTAEERLKNAIHDANLKIKEQSKKSKELGESLEKTGDKIKSVGDKISKAGQTLSLGVTAPIVAAGTKSFKMAAELEDSFGAVEQIFKTSSDTVKNWADSLPAYYGIAENEALSYSSTMGAMLQNIGGLSEEEAAKQSQILTELAGDLSAMFGGTTESAIQALTGALKGNNAMLDNYGMGVNDATIKAKALEMGIYSGSGAMSLQAKQAATLALIMEQTADAQGQAAREADGASGTLKSLTTTLKNISTEIGEVLLPVITPLLQKVRDFIAEFKALDDAQKEQIVKIAMIAAAVGPLLLIVGKSVSAIGAITGGVGKLIQIMPSLSAGLTSTTQIFGSVNATIGMTGAAIAGVVAVIGILVAAFVTLWNNNEEFRNKITEIWTGIKSTFEELTSGIVERLNELGLDFDNFGQVVGAIWRGFTELLAPLFEGAFNNIASHFKFFVDVFFGIWDTLKAVFTGDWQGAWEGVKSIFTAVWTRIKDVFSNVTDTIKGICNTFLGWFGSSWNDAWNRIKSLYFAIWDSIKQKTESVKNSITSTFNNLKTSVSNIWNSIKTAITTPVQNAVDKVKSLIDRMKSMFNFNWSLPRLKLPHFSVTGSFSLNPPSAPKFGISWYKEGGLMTKPTIFGRGMNNLLGGGEAGPEAILPLSKKVLQGIGHGIVQSTTDLIDQINSKSGSVVYVTMNNEIASSYDSARAIRELDKELGRLGVKTSRGMGRA